MLSKSRPPNAHHFRWANWVYPCLHAILVVIAFSAHADTDCTAVTEIPTAQCETLIDLYNSTDGDNWTANDNWLQNNTPCNWRGLTCSGGGVTEIDLSNKGLNGPLPDISALTDLTLVKLYSNALTGPIPDLSALTQLSYLHLYGNDFTGSIPELKTLTQLKNLYLGANQLTGPIPDFTGLTNLQYIQLYENELSGEMPDFRDNTNLRELRFEYNQLTGTIPDLTHLTNMQRLGLYANQFTGEIPDLTGLTNLWYLAISHNQLSGTIPAFINQLTNLKELYLNNNQLTGTIFDLSALTNLQTLKFNDNQLTGTIPGEVSTLTNLRNLALNSNQLTGTIPDLSQLTALSYLALSYNQFTGSMPSFKTLTNLKEVYLQGNQFTGNVPDLSSLGSVQKLALHGNKLTGTIPDLSALEKVWYLAFSGNQLTGPIPDLSKLTRVSELYLHTNQLSGSIPDLSQLANLRYLQFHSNQLSGSIPDLSQLTNLTILYLQSNQLSGSIPDLSALTHLQKLALHVNQLTGEIPDVSQLSNVWYFAVSNNQLSGQIPDLTGLTKLKELYLHDNSFTGTIPDVSVLPNATRLWFANNLLTGPLPELNSLTKLQSLRTQNNNLSGAIPNTSALVNLQEFYITGNPELCKDADINYTGRSEVDNIALCPGADINLVANTNATACVGQNMAITVTKQLPQTVDGIQIGLTFEPATLKVNSLTGSGVLDTLKQEFDNDAGTVQFAAGNFFSDPVANDFELVTINVTPLAASSGTSVSFNAAQTVATYNRNDLESDTENLTLAIEYCPESPVTFSCDNVEGLTSAQCEVLVALYDDTDGNNWTNNAGWKRTNTPCSWQGLTCDNGEVTAIDLKDNHLNGDVPNLGALPSLQTLELTSNQLCKTPNTDYSQWSAFDDVLSCDDPSYGLVLHLPFDGNANDASGNGHDGIVNGATLTTDRHGSVESAYAFDGQTYRIKLPHSSLNELDTFSMGFWSKTADTGTNKHLVTSANSGQHNEFLIRHDAGKITILIKGVEHKFDTPIINDGVWHLVNVVRFSSTVEVFVDGSLAATWQYAPAGQLAVDLSGFWLGGDQDCLGGCWDKNQQFSGIMDDFTIHNRALTASEIQSYYDSSKPATTGCNGDIQLADNLCEGLTAYYPMDGNANDASGNGSNGVVNGATLTTDRHGNADSAYEFDGQSNDIRIADSPQVDFAQSQDFAVAFWVKAADIQPFTASGDNDIIEKWDGKAKSPSYPYVIRYLNQKSNNHGKIAVGRYDGDNNPSFVSTVKVNDDQFHHIVFVKNGEQLQLFIDGNLDNTLTDRTVGNTANNSPLFLGRRGSPLKNQFKGVIDDLLIHNRALTEAEVQTLYDSNKPATTGCNGDIQLADNLCEGLTAYYPMNGNANDASGNDNDGTVNGATLTTDRHGNADNAYYFNGNGHGTDSIQIPHTVINGLTDVTTSVWIQTDDLEQGILSGANNAQQNHYLLYMIHGKIQAHIKQDDSFVTSSIINDGQWHQIVFVREGSSGLAQVFIDGNSVGSKTLPAGALSISPNGLWIGRDQDCVGGCFEDYQDFLGSIDDLIIYNRALTASEIQSHYDSTKPTTGCNGVTEIPTEQCEALVALYNNTDGDNWTNNEGWKTTDTPCSWQGVTCENGEVTAINLTDNQLNGSFPELGNLPSLQTVALTSNQLCQNPNTDYSQWSEIDDFSICGNPNITLTSPAHGATSIPITGQVFTWEPVANAKYNRIVISTQADFSGFTDLSGDSYCDATCLTEVDINISSYTVPNLSANTTYYWRVRTNTQMLWSEVRSFTTGGLLAHWNFDNCDATDSSDNSFDGIIHSEPSCVDGVMGKALSFDGTDDFIEINGGEILANPVITTAAWIYKTADTKGLVLSKIDLLNNNGDNYAMAISSGKTEDRVTGQDLSVSYTLSDEYNDKWVHTVFVLTTESIAIYINGELKNQKNLPEGTIPYMGDAPLQIAGTPLSNHGSKMGAFFNSVMDEVRLYNRALTDAEIQALYNAANPVASETVLEDGEDGNTVNWSIYDNITGDAVLSNVVDSDKNSRVIDFTGNSESGYQLVNHDGSPLSNTNFIARWSIKTSTTTRQTFFWHVKTSGTVVFLEYRTNTPLGCGIAHSTATDVVCGLGYDLQDGTWHTITRDLEADLKAAAPNLELQEVEFLQIRMAGRIDDIQLLDSLPPEPQLVAHYCFDDPDNLGKNCNADEKHGTPQNGVSSTDGKTGTAALLDGEDDIIDLPDFNPLFMGNAFTVTAWFKPNEIKARNEIVWFQDDQPAISLTNEEVLFKYKHGNDATHRIVAHDVDGNQILPLGNWNCVAYTYDSNDDKTARMYLNGNQLVEKTLEGYFVPTQTGLGRIGGDDNWDQGRAFNGAIDDVRIYNYALSDEDIQALCPAPPVSEVVLEDAEDGNTDDWSIYENRGGDAAVSTVFDDGLNSQVLEFNGSNWGAYKLSMADGSSFGNTTNTIAQWRMKKTEGYYHAIYWRVKTSGSVIYLAYRDHVSLGCHLNDNQEYVTCGIDMSIHDGEWHTITRDLEADLKAADPNLELLEVEHFQVRVHAKGRVDDIKLINREALNSHTMTGNITENGQGISGVSFAASGANCQTSDSNGDFTCTVPEGWFGTLVPEKDGYLFEPFTRVYRELSTDMTAQHFTAKPIPTDDTQPIVHWTRDMHPIEGNGAVHLPYLFSDYVDENFTVTVRAKPTAIKSINYIFHANDDYPSMRLDGANRLWFAFTHNGTAQPRPISQTGSLRSEPLPLNEWVEAAVTWDGTDFVGYINGERIGSATLPKFIKGNRVAIGWDGGTNRHFEGEIAEVKIYKRALTFFSDCNDVTEISTAQCETLVALYDSTNGDNWTNNEGWKTTDTPCSWYGIECSDGNVTKMSLEDNQLSGTIPELSNLTGLMDLRLYSNQLTGTIPELSALTQLQTLFLNNNQLSGPIPELTALTELQRIYLALNKLSGPMPELTALTNLEDLDFSHNQLTGSIPDLSQLAELQRFRVLNNQFSGEIPALGSLAKLDAIDLTGNSELCQNPSADYAGKTEVDAFANCASFCDEVTEIPTAQCEALVALYDSTNGDNWKNNSGWKQTNTPCSWFGVTCNGNSVIKLTLGGNDLTGTMPKLDGLVDIQELYLRENKLISGTIPELKSLTKLRKLYLNDNQLSGPIPELKDLVNLQELKLGGNKLTGPIPDLSTLTNLQILGLAYNQLTGNIPEGISQLTQLHTLGLGGNQLTGNIPDLSRLTNLQLLYLQGNSLSGAIPDWSSLTQLKEIYLYTNQLTGSIPSVSNLVNLKELKLGSNQLTGTIPDVSTLTNLIVLALGYNQLSGPIPALNTLTNLQGLFLRENNLSGSIPELNSLTNLRTLYLDGNNLSGSIPEWNTLTKLEIIYLTNNQLTGSIPDLTNLTKLIELRAAKNQLTGNIPDLSTLTQLTQLHLGLNQLSGSIPDLSALTHLQGVGLHDNQLTGPIPALSHLTSLQTMWLLNNNLTGPIPDLSNLRNVRELRLQNNELSGPIPALDNLTNLTFLGLDGNTDLCRGTNIDYDGRTQVNQFAICEGAEVKIIAQTSASACIGQNLTVTVQKQLTQNVDAIQLALTFDPNTLKVDSVTGNTVLNRELDNRFNNSEGTVEFAAANVVGDGISEEFTVATINFTPLASSVGTALQFHSTQTFATLKGATLRQDLQGITLAIKDCVSEVIIQPEEHSAIWTLVDETIAIDQTGTSLDAPKSLSFDASGNAYIADSLNHRILKRDTQGNLSVVAGNGKRGFAGDEGPAIEAKLNNPQGVAVDHEGNLYIADTNNHRIRKVDSNGIITTVVGMGKAGYAGDNGLATAGQLRKPTAIVFDNNGHIYIADSGNHRIRKVSGQRTRKPNANSIITTVAGSGRSGYQGDNGPATGARLSNPTGLAVDNQNNLYIADTDNHRIRKVDLTGTITTVAGNGNKGYSGDGDPATAAQINAPTGLEVDSTGNLYIADKNNHRVRKVDNEGIITTFTGTGKSGTSTDGILAGVAQISQPSDVALDQYGNLYIVDKSNDTIRKIGEKDGETDKAEAPPHQIADCPNTEVTGISENECYALIALYDSTKGPEWTNNDGWKATDTPCQWTGVTCQDGHVTAIDLPNNNLVGDIPVQIGALINLEELNLNDNQISGAIPTTIEHLNNLETLNLENNDLTGSLPTELGDATNLQTVNLANNQISGAIPDLNALTQLQTLNLSDNLLNGPVPDLTALTALQTLEISGENQQLCQDNNTDYGNMPVGNLEDCPTDNQLPIAAFSATPNKGEAPLTVQLDARISHDPFGNISAYFWETSDGQVLIGSTSTITYTKSGTYEIKLRVTDHDGAPSINVATRLIEVNPGPDQVTLNLDKDGMGLGTVYIRRDEDPAITCNAKCQVESQDYPQGSEIKLLARAAKGSLFTGWRDDCVGTAENDKIIITMDNAKHCTAVFELESTPPSTMHALTIDSVSTMGSGGTIEVRDILCHEPPCLSYQQADKQIKITGTPMPHAYFIGWNLDCPVIGELTDATNLVVLAGDATCIAYFGNDSDLEATNVAKEFEQEGELHTGESVTEIYPPADNRERYEQAFRVAEKAMMTVEDQKLLDKESWPDHFNDIENWFDPLPDNLYVERVQIKSGEETIDDSFQVKGKYVRVDVRLLNTEGEEELVPILVYYDEDNEPTVEELAPPAEDANLRRSTRGWYHRVRRIIRYCRKRWHW